MCGQCEERLKSLASSIPEKCGMLHHILWPPREHCNDPCQAEQPELAQIAQLTMMTFPCHISTVSVQSLQPEVQAPASIKHHGQAGVTSLPPIILININANSQGGIF